MINEQIRIRRNFDGTVQFTGPACFVVSPMIAVEIAQAFLHEAGVEVIFADPGQTVIRPPAVKAGNGNGVLR